MTKSTALSPEVSDRIHELMANMKRSLASGDLEALSARCQALDAYLDSLLDPPDPYADRGLRPGLNVVGGERIIQGLKEAVALTKSTGDPVFDPTLPKDAA